MKKHAWILESSTDTNTWGNDYPKCPYCGGSNEPWDYSEDNSEYEHSCEHCQKKFMVTPRTSWSYDSVGICEKHKLKRIHYFLTSGKKYICTECKGEVHDWTLFGGKHARLTLDEYEIIEDKEQAQ